MRVQLKPQKRNPDRTSVYLNGRFCVGVDRETLERLGYFTRTDLSQTELEKLLFGAERTQARNYAFRLLSYRMRSRKEMTDKLARREFSESVKKDVMAELENLGLVDDEKFAQSFARDRLSFGLKGKQMIFAELKKKGIDNQHIKTVLAGFDPSSEEEACKKLILKYSNRYRKFSLRERKQKYYGLLSRRGFSYSVIKKALQIEDTE